MSNVTQHDCVLDLVQALEAVPDGFLFGSETTTIEDVTTVAYYDRKSNIVTVTLSDGTKVELRVEVLS